MAHETHKYEPARCGGSRSLRIMYLIQVAGAAYDLAEAAVTIETPMASEEEARDDSHWIAG